MFQTLGACLPGVSLPESIQQTLQRRASNCQAGGDHDDGDDSHDESHNAGDDRYVLANCRANLVVVEDQKQLAKILEVVVILSIIIVILINIMSAIFFPPKSNLILSS